MEAVGIGNQIPGQMSVTDLQGVQPTAVEIDGKAVDAETGEILDEASGNSKLIDMRNVRQA